MTIYKNRQQTRFGPWAVACWPLIIKHLVHAVNSFRSWGYNSEQHSQRLCLLELGKAPSCVFSTLCSTGLRMYSPEILNPWVIDSPLAGRYEPSCGIAGPRGISGSPEMPTKANKRISTESLIPSQDKNKLTSSSYMHQKTCTRMIIAKDFLKTTQNIR